MHGLKGAQEKLRALRAKKNPTAQEKALAWGLSGAIIRAQGAKNQSLGRGTKQGFRNERAY